MKLIYTGPLGAVEVLGRYVSATESADFTDAEASELLARGDFAEAPTADVPASTTRKGK